jgi:hypothetical protein
MDHKSESEYGYQNAHNGKSHKITDLLKCLLTEDGCDIEAHMEHQKKDQEQSADTHDYLFSDG